MLVFNDQGGGRMDITEDITQTLRAEDHGHPPLIVAVYGFKPDQGAAAHGMGWEREVAPSLTVGTNQGVLIEYG